MILITAVFFGCGKESREKEYLARVNDTYFTRDDLNAIIDSGSGKNFYKNEIIRDWINKELLYEEAKNSGILDDKNFQKIRNQSNKELAVTFLINKIFNEEKLKIDPEEVKEYYEKNKDNFRLFQNAFLINLIQFNDEDKAIEFRAKAFDGGWENAEKIFSNSSGIVSEMKTNLVYGYEIQPAGMIPIVRELLPGEISIVINDSTGNYYLLQLLEKYEKGSIPPYGIVSNLVHDRYIALKKDQFITNYLKELYSKNEIEVK
ncbi:MAG TPA: peptidylprolyl isomerase [Ignavibacteriaceae bacterium]|nr:peptidylprolyl isomerase [Ignavibacteriaceae bacterium]